MSLFGRNKRSRGACRPGRRTATKERRCRFERLEDRRVLAGQFGAMPDDTGEFLLGDVLVTLVLMESSTNTSLLNDNSENWTAESISAVKTKSRKV